MGVGMRPAASIFALASRSWSRLSPILNATWCRPGRTSLGALPSPGTSATAKSWWSPRLKKVMRMPFSS
jgi:hypothetical protein